MSKKSTVLDHCTFRLQKDLSKKLDRTSVSKNTTKSQVIVSALDQYLSRKDDMEILYRDIKRLENRVDTVKRSADLSVEIQLNFVKEFYTFIEIYEKDNNRDSFIKEKSYDKFKDDIFDLMLTKELFSERLEQKENEIVGV